MKVLIDTGAWLALEIKNDKNHLLAKQYVQDLKQRRALFFTNHYVLSETYTRLIYDVNLKAAQQLHQKLTAAIQTDQLRLIEPQLDNIDRIFGTLSKYSDHNLSFTDGTIVINFEDFQLDQVFTFDKHFRHIHLPTNPF